MVQGAAKSPIGEVEDWLREGIAAAKAGERGRARKLLVRVVERDEENVQAWLWLSEVVDSLENQEVCLENVLTLEPGSARVRKRLAWVRKRMEAQSSSAGPAFDSSAAGKPAGAEAFPAQDTVKGSEAPPFAVGSREDRASSPTQPSEPEPQLAAARDEFANEYLCPYCAAPTEPGDRKCAACGHRLWVQVREREKRSATLWVLIGLQFVSTLALGALPVFLMVYVAMEVGVEALTDLLYAYLGLPTSLSPEAIGLAFSLVPRFVLLLFILPSIISLVVLIGLYLRWRPVYYLLLFDAVGEVIAAIVSTILAQNMVLGVVGLVLALGRLLLIFQVGEDFHMEKRRILLRISPGLKTCSDLLIKADLYNKQKMWAMTAIHLRRAAGLMPNRPHARLALAAAYMRLERYDRAARELAEVKRNNPRTPRIRELEALLDEMRATDDSD